jgi:DNA-binding NarL/FixJ family response regulator
MVEDHPIVQAGLARIVAELPDIELVCAVERIEDLPVLDPPADVTLLDLHLPGGLDGIGAVRHLSERGHCVLVVTADVTDVDEVADALAAGAHGYLTKQATVAEYAAAIRAVAAGGSYIGARLAAHARRYSSRLAPGDPGRLTPRESDVAALVVDGYTNAEIAGLLGITERTVDGHLENIKQKISESRRVRVALRLKELGYTS